MVLVLSYPFMQLLPVPHPVGYHKVRRLDELSESEEEVYVKENASVYNTYKYVQHTCNFYQVNNLMKLLLNPLPSKLCNICTSLWLLV